MDSFNANQESWNRRQMPGFNPHISCSAHSQCRNVDMNMICNDKNSTCQCRETMQWNDEALECQIFIVSVDFTNFFPNCNYMKKKNFQDVDCKEEKSAEAILVNGTSTTTVVAKSVGTNGTEPEENEEFDDSFVANLTDSSGNVNVSEITADEVSCFFF